MVEGEDVVGDFEGCAGGTIGTDGEGTAIVGDSFSTPCNAPKEFSTEHEGFVKFVGVDIGATCGDEEIEFFDGFGGSVEVGNFVKRQHGAGRKWR